MYNSDAVQIHKIDETGNISGRLTNYAGNIITKYIHFNIGETTLIERKYDGAIVREYKVKQMITDYFVDKYGRFVVCNAYKDFGILDSECNYLNSCRMKPHEKRLNSCDKIRYSPTANEIVALSEEGLGRRLTFNHFLNF